MNPRNALPPVHPGESCYPMTRFQTHDFNNQCAHSGIGARRPARLPYSFTTTGLGGRWSKFLPRISTAIRLRSISTEPPAMTQPLARAYR